MSSVSRPRKKAFGPLLYVTLAAAVPLGVLGLFLRAEPELRAWAAAKVAARAARATLGAARDPNHRDRALACRALVTAALGPATVVRALVVAAKDARDEVRFEVAQALGR